MAQSAQEPEDDLGHISQLAWGAALRFWAMMSASQQQVLGAWVLMVFLLTWFIIFSKSF